MGGDGGHLASFQWDGTTYLCGTGAPTGTNHGSDDAATNIWTVSTLAGGKFVVGMDSSLYTDTPPVTTTSRFNEPIGYTLIDSDGDTASSTLTISVLPPPPITLRARQTTITGLNLGLAGAYFGDNDNRTGSTGDAPYKGPPRQHSDDGSAKYGTQASDPNLNNLTDAEAIVEGRNANPNLIGSAVASNPQAADATFSANKLEFGLVPASNTPYFGNNLGTNQVVTAGGSLDNTSNLFQFLNVASNNVDSLAATSGVGTTTDAIVRMVGYIDIPAGGSHDFRVTGDDGYRVLIGGRTIAEVDNIQNTATNTVTGKVLGEGLQAIDIVSWDQGGQADVRVEVKTTGAADSSYKIIGTSEFALVNRSDVPTPSATQDLVETSVDGVWAVRSGQEAPAPVRPRSPSAATGAM